MSNESAINWEQCIDRAAGRQDVAENMLNAIIDELPIHKRELIQAYQDRDTKLLASIAHKLSGVCCYSGLPKLKVAARCLEEELLNGSMASIKELFESLLINVDHVLEAFKKEFSK